MLSPEIQDEVLNDVTSASKFLSDDQYPNALLNHAKRKNLYL